MSASDRGPGEGENPGGEEGEEEGSSTGNAPAGSSGSSGQDHAPDLVVDDEEQVLYPGLAPVVFFCVKQTTRPRSWCLRMVCNPYPFMLVILLNCVTLGLFQPCEDIRCQSQWCAILQAFDDFIFAFFAVEMVIKMVALGIFGPKCYLGDTWNRLDFFIVMAGMLEYSLDGHNTSLSAIRTVRVLRPLRAINRVPSMRILVTLLLDTLPMLGNVLLLCFFVFFIFGIVGVQLWAGLLRNRCFLEDDFRRWVNPETEDTPFICSSVRDNGMLRCHNVPPLKEAGVECHLGVAPSNHTEEGPVATSAAGCINWNQYYNVCRPGELNPHKGAVSFDNIGYAWIAIFQVITLEGWVDIMYYVMDAHSFYNFIYFILLIIVGSFFMINLCLVVIATQFSETKQRENQLMQEQRARFLSNDSTLASFSEPGTCYEELLKYVGHLYRKLKRRALRVYGRWKTKRRKKVNPNSAGGEARRWRGRRSNGRHGRSVQHLVQHHQHQPYHHHYPLSNGSQGPRDTLETTDFWRPQNCLGDGMNYPIIVPSTLCSHTAATPRGKGKKTSGNTQALVPCKGLHLPAGGTTPSWLQLETIGCPYCDRREPGNTDSDGSEGEAVLEFTRDPGRKWGGAHGGRRSAIRHWDKFQTKLRRIAESKYFNRGIMIAILVNTLSMGIEYHQQPDELTDILEISNVVFTSMFALEMVLKLLAFSIVGYIRNPYNIFDGIIVIISVWEILSQAEGGLSVLRTFRLLRVLKLVRFLPALRRQLVVLMKTMDNVATFCMLLMLFIFIFSILGMHLFGCKFSLRTENGDTIPDRKNFDSLLWAIVTVFQILTQEDWNVVLYNGMASTTPWAALYFVALMSFGNYVLFNLLVAILVEGFQAEVRQPSSLSPVSPGLMLPLHCFSPETRTCFLMMVANGHMEPSGCIPTPTIMRTAATPTPTPKGSLGAESTQGFDDSRRGSGASIDPHVCVQRSLSSHPSSPSAPRGAGSSWGSRRSSWNSLSRAPSLKRRDTSGERESLLSGDGRGSLDDSDGEECSGKGPRSRVQQHAQPGGDLNPPDSLFLHNCQHEHVSLLVSLVVSVHLPDLPPPPGPFQSCAFRLRKFLESFRPRWCIERAEWSLYAFSPHNQFRRACQRLISHRMFDHVVLLFIFLNCITIALERPDIPAHSTERVFLSVSNYVFTVIFVAEMAVKVVALGFCAGKGSYLRSSWNVLDGALVFVSIVDVLVLLASAGGNRILGILRVLRLLRTLRPLRVISRAPGLKLVVETLITSLRPIGNIVLICCAFFIVFGILGVQLFKGKFYHCEGADVRNISNKSECLQARYRWVQRKYNFDNLGQALMALFVLSSKDGWVNIMYDGLDAVGVDQQPVRNHNPWMLLYFISFLLIVSFFVLNMFVGVVVENFHKCRQDQEEEEARRREEKQMRRLNRRRRSKENGGPEAQQQPYYANYSPVRLYIHTLCTNHYLDIFITIIIAVNVVTMSLEHYNQPRYLEEALKYCNYFFTVVFVLEALLKFVAFGFRRFFKDRWNQLDLAIILLSILGIILEEIEISAALPMNPTIIRIMRVLRIARVLKLLKMATGMRALLDTVVQALPQVGNLGLLFMLLFFIYAALGVELFGKLECTDENPCEGLSRHATFENFGMAFLTLFRISTGDNWNGIMKDTLRECQSEKHCLSYLPYISPLYFVTFVLIAQFVLVNVVVAVLMKHLEESNKEAREDGELDVDTEAETTRRLSAASGTVELDSEGRATYVGPVPTSSRQRRSLPCRPSRPNDLPPGLVDLEDEEVWHINSSARSLVGVGQPVTRSHSLSPCAAPDAKLPVPPKSGSAAHLPACGAKDKDLRKFYSVDAHGFLAKPSWAEDTRRHSIEICLPADDGQGATPRTPPPRRPAGPRKKKMSPPCVPTEPPVASLAVPPESSTLLRRRTPSCEAYPQDAAEPAPPADPLPVRRDQLSFDQSDLTPCSALVPVLVFRSHTDSAGEQNRIFSFLIYLY
uniref:Calcium voltage-gated channel subunit alpha1 H n=1 Tax=Scleropages formosus TaxID=113540 RepID=A0A8C9WSZ3_SCLFO